MELEIEEEKTPNKIQAYIEKRKSETEGKEREEEEQKAKVKQKNAERSEKLHKVIGSVGDAINTGANIVQSIPHFATLAIGAGVGNLFQKYFGDKKDK